MTARPPKEVGTGGQGWQFGRPLVDLLLINTILEELFLIPRLARLLADFAQRKCDVVQVCSISTIPGA